MSCLIFVASRCCGTSLRCLFVRSSPQMCEIDTDEEMTGITRRRRLMMIFTRPCWTEYLFSSFQKRFRNFPFPKLFSPCLFCRGAFIVLFLLPWLPNEGYQGSSSFSGLLLPLLAEAPFPCAKNGDPLSRCGCEGRRGMTGQST